MFWKKIVRHLFMTGGLMTTCAVRCWSGIGILVAIVLGAEKNGQQMILDTWNFTMSSIMLQVGITLWKI
jgi:hypothetical protein